MFSFGDDPNGGFLGMLGKMFQQSPADPNAPGAPMQILPQIQQDAQADPSMIDKLQAGVNKNAGNILGFAGGLLNQKPQQMQPLQMNMSRPTLPFSMGPGGSPMMRGR